MGVVPTPSATTVASSIVRETPGSIAAITACLVVLRAALVTTEASESAVLRAALAAQVARIAAKALLVRLWGWETGLRADALRIVCC